MGAETNAAVEVQRHAVLKPATGDYDRILMRMSEAAFDLIKIIELERSGIRDGNGCGGDVLWRISQEMIELMRAAKWRGPTDPDEAKWDDECEARYLRLLASSATPQR
jgi:hypothetical protein